MSAIVLPIFSLCPALYHTSKAGIIEFDKLGTEYRLGRLNSETIFEMRKDLSPEEKGEIYKALGKKREEIKKL